MLSPRKLKLSRMGRARTRKKAMAARKNGHLGGRPRSRKQLRGQIRGWRIWSVWSEGFVVTELGRDEWTEPSGARKYRDRMRRYDRKTMAGWFVVPMMKNGTSPMRDAIQKNWENEQQK